MRLLNFNDFQSSIRLLVFTTLFVSSSSFAVSASHDSLYFFYQRTVYLDNLLMDGAWFSNPALTASFTKPTAFLVNSGPLGDSKTLSSVRFFFPAFSSCAVGLGVTGATGDPNVAENQSFQATEQGATYQSHFKFFRPTFELAVGLETKRAGSIGVLQSFGLEYMASIVDAGQQFFVWGTELGWISPSVLGFSLSLSSLSVGHFQYNNWWDHSGKIGLKMDIDSGLVLGSWEYSISLGDRPALFCNKDKVGGYEVMKVLMSLRMYKIVGVLIGYSTDTEIFSDNGPTSHVGLELRRSDVYPFYGGYDLGVSFTHNLATIHRFWVGYAFK